MVMIAFPCCFLRLCVKHALPPLRAQDEETDSDSSESSVISSDDDSAPRRRPGRVADPVAKALRKDLKPFFEASREVVKFYRHNTDATLQLEKDAKEAGVSYQSYSAETATRWSSGLISLVSTLRNNQAHMLSKHKHNTHAPDGFNQEQVVLGRELCAILTPFKLATKLLEGDKVCCSVYLPIWHSISSALCKSELKIPKELVQVQCLGVIRRFTFNALLLWAVQHRSAPATRLYIYVLKNL